MPAWPPMTGQFTVVGSKPLKYKKEIVTKCLTWIQTIDFTFNSAMKALARTTSRVVTPKILLGS